MSILTQFSLESKEKKETLNNFHFVLKRKQGGGGTRKGRRNLIRITPNTITIQPEIAGKHNIKRGWYGGLILDDQKLAVILRDQEDINLYAIQGGSEGPTKRHSRHINVPKASRDFVAGFIGMYQGAYTRMVEDKYLILSLEKQADRH